MYHENGFIDVSDKILEELRQKLLTESEVKINQHLHLIPIGDYVIVINASKIKVSGQKYTDKKYYRHSLYPGGLKTKSFKELVHDNPERIVEEAVKGMLPKNKLGKSRIKKLKVFSGPVHDHESQQPSEWNPL